MAIYEFKGFVEGLFGMLGSTPELDLHEGTYLINDLEFDSMAFVEVIGVMTTMGAPVDDQAVASARTLGDLYHLYTANVAGSIVEAVFADPPPEVLDA